MELSEREKENRTNSIDFAIDVLNRALRADRQALEKILDYRVECNKKLADDPTIQVVSGEDLEGVKISTVGALGLINGIFGIRDNGWGYIAAEYEVVCLDCKEEKDGNVGEYCPDCNNELKLGRLINFKRTDI